MRQRIPAYDFAIKYGVDEINRVEFRKNKAAGWVVVAFEEFVHMAGTMFYRPVYRYRWPEVA